MKKVLGVLLMVLAIVMVFKFLTSSFFLWMVFGAAVPQVIRYLYKTGVITRRSIYINAYKDTTIGIFAIFFLRLFFAHTFGFSFLVGGMAGVAISMLVLDGVCKK